MQNIFFKKKPSTYKLLLEIIPGCLTPFCSKKNGHNACIYIFGCVFFFAGKITFFKVFSPGMQSPIVPMAGYELSEPLMDDYLN